MNITIENPHSDNKNLELLRFERAIFIALAEKIIEVLENPNSLSQMEKEFWLKRAISFNEFAAEDSEAVKKVIDILDSQTKAENARLN